MLPLLSYGIKAERLMKNIFNVYRIRNASSDFDADFLLNTAQLVDPVRYKKCMSIHKLGAHAYSPEQILDYLYGLDFVIDVGSDQYVGLDFTVNAAKVPAKLSKCHSLSRMSKSININHSIVILIVGDLDNPDPTVIQSSTKSLMRDLFASFETSSDTRLPRYFKFAVSNSF